MLSTSPDGNTLKYLDIPRALRQVGGVEALRSMLPMLQELLQRDVPQIAHLLDTEDATGASRLLHSFKGCMPIFCTPTLCEHLEKVEQLSKSGVALEVGRAYSALMPELQALQLEIDRYLALPPDAE
jgi:HPt (histidine-containing phosphotransfer) domain-containing protein